MYIDNPNIPKGKVSLGIIDGRAEDSIKLELKKRDIKLILTEKCTELYDAISYHPDVLIHHLGGKDIIAAPNTPYSIISDLESNEFNVIKGRKKVGAKYPEDIAYNVARIGKNAVCNIKYTDEYLLDSLKDRGVNIIDTNQGYSKCSVCIVAEDALIVSDEGIYNTLSKYNFDILKIRSGFIELKGVNYGFIGGASGFVSNDTLAFSGNVTKHPDYKKIMEFATRHGVNIISLSQNTMSDIGTFIPLKQI